MIRKGDHGLLRRRFVGILVLGDDAVRSIVIRLGGGHRASIVDGGIVASNVNIVRSIENVEIVVFGRKRAMSITIGTVGGIDWCVVGRVGHASHFPHYRVITFTPYDVSTRSTTCSYGPCKYCDQSQVSASISYL